MFGVGGGKVLTAIFGHVSGESFLDESFYAIVYISSVDACFLSEFSCSGRLKFEEFQVDLDFVRAEVELSQDVFHNS